MEGDFRGIAEALARHLERRLHGCLETRGVERKPRRLPVLDMPQDERRAFTNRGGGAQIGHGVCHRQRLLIELAPLRAGKFVGAGFGGAEIARRLLGIHLDLGICGDQLVGDRHLLDDLDALVARALMGATQGVMQVAITAPQNQNRRNHDQDQHDHQQ